jgi:hypothetical protein
VTLSASKLIVEEVSMVTTPLGQWTFIRRLDPYGNVESICPVCFETVAQSEKEEDLARAECSHVCDPDSLGNLAYFSGPAHD